MTMRMDRRQFLALGAACAVSRAFGIPGLKHYNPNYWCTWGIQNGKLPVQSAMGARDSIDEERLFGSRGWARTEFAAARAHLYLMLDDGWDVSHGLGPKKDIFKFASLDPDPVRFPNFGMTRGERLRTLNARVEDAGWQGAALWVACQCHGEGCGKPLKGMSEARAEWTRKLEESAAAGIRYWKVDWGARTNSVEFRGLLSELKGKIAPEMIVEHAPQYRDPFNGLFGSGRLVGSACGAYDDALFGFSDVVRIYDMLQPIDNAVTMERIAYYSELIDRRGYPTLLNVEGSVLHGAVLGHSFGVMRAKGLGKHAIFGGAPDVSRLNERIAEVIRAVNWQEIAPPFGGRFSSRTRISDEILTDEWHYSKDEGWLGRVWEKDVEQKAPMAIARGASLPDVVARKDEKPFVCVGRNPNGALSVCALPRVKGGRWGTPLADIRLNETVCHGQPLAAFGEMASLTVCVPGKPKSVIVRDLAGGARHDIVTETTWANGRLTFPGRILAEIGRETAPDDPSAPGVLVEVCT